MSGFDLREFNILSRKHHYFMTNNRMNGFPALKENSLFLQKILLNRNANSCDKIKIKESKPKKFVRFAKPENIPYKEIYQSPIAIKKKINNSNEVIHNRRYIKNSNNNNINVNNSNNIKRINLYKKNPKIELSNDMINPNYYKISINKADKKENSNDNYYKNSHIQSNLDISDSYNRDNKMIVLNYRGRKIFTSNSFYGLNKSSASNSPEKENLDNSKESELFRNSKELKKKKEEILQRKMKRESSAIKREMLKNEKDKDIKDQKIDLNNNTNNNKSNTNKIRIIPLNKEINNNLRKNNSRFKSNDNEKKGNVFNINIKSRNKNLLNNSLKYNNIRRVYKFNNNINTSKEKNSITKESQDSHLLNGTFANILYPKKENFKVNNIYISKFTEKTPPKNNIININSKIKENLDYLRKTKNSEVNADINAQTLKRMSKKTSPEKTNNSYNLKKKFIEDVTYEAPTIYSKDKKVSIKVHVLQNINETFLGKRPTSQKLKMQRVINVCFILGNKNHSKFLSGYRFSRRKKDLKSLASIKEEEEKSKIEPNTKYLKTDTKIEIKEKPVLEKNIRRRYIRRFNKK
jgi:hypothetical protein